MKDLILCNRVTAIQIKGTPYICGRGLMGSEIKVFGAR
jgi:hypothetical protein